MLSSEARTTDSNLCGGSYVCGAARHWRKMERALAGTYFSSTKRARRPVTTGSCVGMSHKGYISTAVQRNRAVRHAAACACGAMAAAYGRKYLNTMPKSDQQWAPQRSHIKSDVLWQNLMDTIAAAPSRQRMLCELVSDIHEQDAETKIVVFAPAGAAFAAAAEALVGLKAPTLTRVSSGHRRVWRRGHHR